MSDLGRELDELEKSDRAVARFLWTEAANGCWYWDPSQPEDRWADARFWATLGHEPEAMQRTDAWRSVLPVPEEAPRGSPSGRERVLGCRHRDGRTVWLRSRSIEVTGPGGQGARVLCGLTDVSAEVDLHAALARLETEAVANRTVGALSHTLNNKLTVIYGAADELEEISAPGSPAAVHAGQIISATDDFATLVRQMQDVISEERLQMRELRLAEIVARVERRLPVLDSPKVEIAGHVSDACRGEGMLHADDVHLLASLFGLVRGAAGAPEVGRVDLVLDVETGDRQDFVARVLHDGRAIDTGGEEAVPDPSRLTPSAGDGRSPGLLYAARVAQRMGGKLSAVNRPGGGVEAVLRLPLLAGIGPGRAAAD